MQKNKSSEKEKRIKDKTETSPIKRDDIKDVEREIRGTLRTGQTFQLFIFQNKERGFQMRRSGE